MGEDLPITQGSAVTSTSDGHLRFGTFEVDLRAGELHKSGLKIKLHGQPFEVLAMLLERPGEVVTREELQLKLWASDTFVDFEHGLNKAINKLREAVGDDADNPRYIETLPRRGYRFIASVNSHPRPEPEPVIGSRVKWLVMALLVGIVTLALAGYALFHRAPKLTDKDTITLSDFDNKTADPVFDGTLRQGLAVQLQQSPFLSLVSDQRIRETLRRMEQPDDTKLTPEVSREVCQRMGSKAFIEGSIAQMGTQYSLILRVVNCASGEVLTSTETRANDKSHVLDALSKAASELRRKLGESLKTVQKFDMPLDQATTSSLEALQAYSFGWRAPNMSAAVSSFQRAIRLDPNFAMAYAALGMTYIYHGEGNLGAENMRRAYELRERVSEREKLYIESHYYDTVLGDLNKASALYELSARLDPGDLEPRMYVADIYTVLGQYEKAVEQWRDLVRLKPAGVTYFNLVESLLYLNRIEEAQTMIKEAQSRNCDSGGLRSDVYGIAFLRNDAAGMAEQVKWAAGKPEEEWMLAREANVAAYSGRLRKAREFSRQAAALAQRHGLQGFAASHESEAALREALFGNAAEARHRAAKALDGAAEHYGTYQAARALGLAGDAARTQAVADDLAKRFPENTLVRFNYVPTLHAQVALDRNEASKAIELLEVVEPYELGNGALFPAYVRGQAYLALRQGTQAAAEFQKILDHRGLVNNLPIGALARLQIGRAYAMQGDTAKAKTAYQDFLTLWKNADPDIPILIAAKAEYGRLQ